MASRGGFLVGEGVLRRKNIPKKSNFTTLKHNKPATKKKKKPEWDSTVNDLNVYKATQEELKRRHEVHKSKNVGLKKTTADKENENFIVETPDDGNAKRKQAILQEILYGQDEFQEVLAETDRTMSAVKDIFGDDPKKFLGFPNVTVAPNIADETSERLKTGPFAEVPETPTHLSTLSDSVMRTPALNEMSDESDMGDSSPEDMHGQSTTFEPRLDLQRYRQFISYEAGTGNEQQHMIPEPSVEGSQNCGLDKVQSNDTAPVTDQKPSAQLRPSTNVPHQTSAVSTTANQIPSNERQIDRPLEKADISKKQKSKGKQRAKDTSMSSNSGLRSLEELKQMVESLEDEIAQYEVETGRQPTATILQTNSFSGYTSSLITAVTKLMKYLKETEVHRKAEAVLRDQIIQGFEEQRALTDALTNDIVRTQEQNVTLQSELHAYKQSTDQQLNYLQRELQVVLKSFEYHTIQSTIDTMKSTKPVPLPQIYVNDNSNHPTKGDYIPVSAEYDKPYHRTNHQGVNGSSTTVSTYGNNGIIPPASAPLHTNQQVTSTSHMPNTHIHIEHPSYVNPNMDNFTVSEPTSNINGSITSESSLHHSGKETHVNQERYGVQQRYSTRGQSSNSDMQSDLTSFPSDPLMFPGTNPSLPGFQEGQSNYLNVVQGRNHEVQTNSNSLPSDPLVYPGMNPHVHDKLPGFQEGQGHYSNMPQLSNNEIETNSQSLPSETSLFSGLSSHLDQAWSRVKENQKRTIKVHPKKSQIMDLNQGSAVIAQHGVGASSNSTSSGSLGGVPIHSHDSLQSYTGDRIYNGSVQINGVPKHSPKPLQNYSDKGYHGSVQMHGVPTASHESLQILNEEKQILPSSDRPHRAQDSMPESEESFLVRSLIKDPQATRELRHRLHGIAMKQKNNVAALKTAINSRNSKMERSTNGQPSPHVHFKLPLEVPNPQGLNQVGLPEKSPSVSPISEEAPVNTGLRKGRQVVVNLPSVWSDVSSIVSI